MRFERRMRPEVRVDLVPLIDVVFQLVIFFMVSTTFILTPGISLTFPAAATAEQVAMTRLVITVASRNEIYLNKEKLDIKTLNERLSEMQKQIEESGKDTTITAVIEADKDIPYSLMIEVLDSLRRNGFKGVNLKTRKLQE
ncbi:MAG: biopolymer transporter ExbD [Spirochaetes bacterium]|nr:MAG: biopolymer transporter ExbD [Spirochaetota bacterium]